MERLTYDFALGGNHCWQVKGADNLECREVCERQGDNGCKTCPISKAFDRLADIEDILGDEYDLDELREMVQAKREERCVVLPCKIGSPVYMPIGRWNTITGYELDECDGFHIAKDGILQVKVKCCTGNHGTYGVPGKTVFLTREDAEAALRREQDGNRI